MSIGKKIRFEVFKRDGFQCAYCGKTPPSVTLEVDHIDPKSKGGKDDINNLITACFDCNRGKTNITLDKIPAKLSENLEVLRERELQLKEYRRMARKIESRTNKDISEIEEVFREQFTDKIFSDMFRLSVKKFLAEIDVDSVKEAMVLSKSKHPSSPDACLRYFCGVCWNKIKRR